MAFSQAKDYFDFCNPFDMQVMSVLLHPIVMNNTIYKSDEIRIVRVNQVMMMEGRASDFCTNDRIE